MLEGLRAKARPANPLFVIRIAASAGSAPALSVVAPAVPAALPAAVLLACHRDAAAGVRAVKSAGAVVMLQNGASAQFPSKPEAAIRTGVADVVLPLEEIPAALLEITRRSVN